MRGGLLIAALAWPIGVLTADPTPAPMPPAKAVESMVVPEGFAASLVAAEPDVVQPISFTIDARGRLWVAEALNYGEWKRPDRHPRGDRPRREADRVP